MLRTVWLVIACIGLLIPFQLYRTGIWTLDADGNLRLHDFVVFWAAAKRVLAEQAMLVYDGASHEAYEAALTNQPPMAGLGYPYPPPSLLFVWPLGFFSYAAAWILFIAAGICAWFAVLDRIVRDKVLAAGMALAAGGATHSLLLGQNGFVTASLICGGMILLRSHKTLAGFAFGLLALKPQLALATFVALVLWREWKTVGAALGLLIALSALTTITFGPGIWSAFLSGNAAFASGIVDRQAQVIEPLMQSVFAMWAGTMGWNWAFAIQAGCAAMALLILARISPHNQRAAALCAVTLLVTPFSFLYDATMLVGAAAFLLRDARSRIEALAISLVAMIPSLWFVATIALAPFVSLLLLGIAYHQAANRLPRGMPIRNASPSSKVGSSRTVQ